MAMFDAQTFINQGVAFAMPDQYPLVPEGDYPATCVDYKVVPPEGERSPMLEVYWKLDGVQASPRRQTVWLDVDANGNLLQGNDVNVGLGLLRTALGQNVQGQNWTPEMLRNARALVHIAHSKNGKYDNVSRVAKLPAGGVPGQPQAPAPQAAQTPQAPMGAPPGPAPGPQPPYGPPGASAPAQTVPQPQQQPWTGQAQSQSAPPAQTPAAPATAPMWGPLPGGPQSR